MRDWATLDDNELLELIARDSEQALDELFTRYFFKLCPFVTMIISSREAAEEIVADLFITIWQNRRTIDINSKISSYLFAAVRNRSLTHLCKNRKNEMMYDIDNCQVVDATTSDSEVAYLDLCNEIDQLIQKLPEQQKIVLRLNKFEGYSPNEIATMLNISPKTVYAHLRDALDFMGRHRHEIITNWLLLLVLQAN